VISPIVFPKAPSSDILPNTLAHQTYRSYTNPNLKLLTFLRSSVLSLTIGVGVASLTLLGTNFSAIAQVPPVAEKVNAQVNLLYVNPSNGDDTQGNGGESNPFKTITHALQKATTNTVIMLAPGTYSTETGEAFPLIMRPGISIQGNTSNQGQGITIKGGGEYLSRSFGGQNVTIIAASQAGVTGLTVTNPNPRGYGLWIESSNPIVAANTFTGNTQDGVFVTGNATPTISQNKFYRNGANGITIAGNSQAQVRENVFQDTGYGINIAQNAAPVIFSNQIQNNRSGILVQANAQPILRNNIIEGSKEDGLVAIAQAMPDLGNNSEPGGNQFRNNTRYDINASAAKKIISATGNALANNRIAGKVEIKAPTTVLARNIQRASGGPSEVPSNGEIIFSAPGLSETPNRVSLPSVGNSSSPHNLSIGKLNTQLLPLQPANTTRLAPRRLNPPPAPPATSPVTGFPVPTSLAGGQTANLPQLNHVNVNNNAIEFAAPPAPTPRTSGKKQPPANRPPAPVGNSNLLPVPSSNIPMGNTRNMRRVPVPQGQAGSLPNNVVPMGANLPPGAVPMGANLPPGAVPMSSNPAAYGETDPMGVRYRILVEVATERDVELVRYIAPEAFATVSRGRNLMQVGVFSDRYNAEGMLNTLNGNGLRTIFEVLN
jgi:parallel beta-helix repeat protein